MIWIAIFMIIFINFAVECLVAFFFAYVVVIVYKILDIGEITNHRIVEVKCCFSG